MPEAGRTCMKLRNLGRKRVQGFGSEDGQAAAGMVEEFLGG